MSHVYVSYEARYYVPGIAWYGRRRTTRASKGGEKVDADLAEQPDGEEGVV